MMHVLEGILKTMNLTAINGALARRLSPRHGIQITNGEPNIIHVGGTPRDYFALQQAIAAVKEVEPDLQIDIELALKNLRK